MGFQFDTGSLGVSRRSGPLAGLATVATHTPGTRLVDALKKAGANTQPYVELEPTAKGAKAFSKRVRAVNANSKFGTAVYVYTDAEYLGKRLFISESGKSGFALSPDGDIVSVFSETGAAEGRGAMVLATQMGGTKLDCFDTELPGYYAAHGFKAVARVPWNDEYTPEGWSFETFSAYNNGRPDVVFMVYDASYTKAYAKTDGPVVATPAEAVALQTNAVNAEASRVAATVARYARVVRDPLGHFAPTAQPTAKPAVYAQAPVRPVVAFFSAVERELQDIDAQSLTVASWKESIGAMSNNAALRNLIEKLLEPSKRFADLVRAPQFIHGIRD